MSHAAEPDSVEVAAQASAVLNSDAKRIVAARLVAVWQLARAQGRKCDSLQDLVNVAQPAPVENECDRHRISDDVRMLIEVTRLAAELAQCVGRSSAGESLRSLCLQLAGAHSFSAVRLQRQLFWEAP